ncbi:hypothetical protein [Arcanobacterium pinnipediorum]|uniref:Uncharacterized protein n=1 Tax=Arcanobacterium pinnipediorum TaxID=1503041 RepID=A0ABY5AEX0_9ACTO|nr:hypothetical protein [Arcanobacterium pinnipediorum]USR78759.1 hypothetical protein NG665_05030 [Arcanobacterium pinnipediorum]
MNTPNPKNELSVSILEDQTISTAVFIASNQVLVGAHAPTNTATERN